MLYHAILYYAMLYYTILHSTILYYTILYYTTRYYTILHDTVSYDTILGPGTTNRTLDSEEPQTLTRGSSDQRRCRGQGGNPQRTKYPLI